MGNRREVINPHDEITIDYTDVEAARLAVIIVGGGLYAIENSDALVADGLPMMLFGQQDSWTQHEYGKSFDEWCASIQKSRIAAALETMRLEHERTSLNDPVGYASGLAVSIRKQIAGRN